MEVSVIVITYNEEQNLGECLESLVAQDYPPKDYEILIVDADSTDRTHEIVKKFSKKYKNISLHIEKKMGRPASRNRGIKEAKYGYVAFTDADCVVPKNWLSELAKAFDKNRTENLAGVGGANIAPKDAVDFMKAVYIAQNTFLGSLGSVQSKVFDKVGKVRSIACANAFYDKRKLEEVDGFTKGIVGDDWELNYKLRKKGYELLTVPKSYVWHKFRATPRVFLKHMYIYGRIRGDLFRRYPDTLFSVYSLSLIFTLIILAPLFYWVHPIFLLPLLYFPTILAYSAYLAIKNKSAELWAKVFAVFVIQHFAYSFSVPIGMVVRFKVRKSIKEGLARE
ncbi:MAG: glycosyltransferase [archaeon]